MRKKKQTGAFTDSFRYALNGIVYALKTERNLRFHVFFAFLVVEVSFFFGLNKVEWAVVLFAIAAVISAELFNTAIENLVDMVSPEYREPAGKVKDIASGAVLFVVFIAVVIGLVIFCRISLPWAMKEF